MVDYGNIETSFFGIKMTVDFYFTKSSLMKLVESLNDVPVQTGVEQKQLIKFGKTLNAVGFQDILDLLNQGYRRVDLDLEGFDLEQSIANSIYKDILDKSDKIDLDAKENEEL